MLLNCLPETTLIRVVGPASEGVEDSNERGELTDRPKAKAKVGVLCETMGDLRNSLADLRGGESEDGGNRDWGI
jgi:hypothetical protein